jgi:uncharacterized protein (DUF488 family)
MRLWTIGHSTRGVEELIAALRAHQIGVLCDVRSFPSSARYPQFNREPLETNLREAGISYTQLGKALGGYRKKTRPDSPHTALRSAGFRNYADHMESAEFAEGIEELLKLAEDKRVALMCAERLWWRCHRSLISDYLAGLRGVEVIHILDEKKTEPHRLHRTARVAEGRLVYDVGETQALV